MTLEEAIKRLEFDRAMILFNATTGKEITPEILKLINGDNYRTYVADGAAIEALKEIQQYRAIGTVEDFVNLKRGAAIMSDLYKFGYTLDETIETMRDVIDTGNHDRMFLDAYYWLKMLSEYREIGTVEECREAMANKKKCEKQWHNDMENPLEPIKVYSALKSEILKLELRIKNRPKDISILDYTVIAALQKVLKNNLEGMEDE